MDGHHHQSFQHMNNNGTMKHCAGCGGECIFFLLMLVRELEVYEWQFIIHMEEIFGRELIGMGSE
jgi:hypothetical protein